MRVASHKCQQLMTICLKMDKLERRWSVIAEKFRESLKGVNYAGRNLLIMGMTSVSIHLIVNLFVKHDRSSSSVRVFLTCSTFFGCVSHDSR